MIMRRCCLAGGVFVLGAVGLLPRVYGGEYIESVTYDNRVATPTQNELTLSIDLNNTGGYDWRIYYRNCSGTGPSVVNRYAIVPKSINIGGGNVELRWSASSLTDLDDNWSIISNFSPWSGTCNSGTGHWAGWVQGVAATAKGNLQNVLPGEYPISITYYVGNAFSTSNGGTINLIKNQGLNGSVSTSQPYSFHGIAACAQDSPTAGATIDFDTVTSNGSVQPGPLTTLGLVCNYDVALNDVTYSLTSNNPVTGEPSTGQNVAVALTNGATVKLDGGNVTQPDPKRVSVNITPSIDTRGATAGEGTGSATLTFTYE